MALHHQKVVAGSDSADPTLEQPSDWNNDHNITTDGLGLTTRTDQPATPASANLTLFARSLGTGYLPTLLAASGLPVELQAFLASSRMTLALPQNGSGTLTSIGGGFGTGGTVTARTVAATSYFTSMRRIGYVAAATGNSRSLLNGPLNLFIGNTAGQGGFRVVIRFGISDTTYAANCSFFAGLATNSNVLSGGAGAETSLNIIGVGADAGDANVQLFTNDGTGTATKIDLGTSFPANTAGTDWYELALFAPSGNAASLSYALTRLNTGAVTQATLTTDIPVANTLLSMLAVRCNNAAATGAGIDVGLMYSDSDNG